MILLAVISRRNTQLAVHGRTNREESDPGTTAWWSPNTDWLWGKPSAIRTILKTQNTSVTLGPFARQSCCLGISFGIALITRSLQGQLRLRRESVIARRILRDTMISCLPFQNSFSQVLLGELSTSET